ncbi:hypothetical protein [Synechococcus sp. BS56D]|uniref:hypothetical protein n=1 Tax=Synechococcus sp. BS56D TaxID=2055944 RepID=UPI00103FFA54|nr:hypothetical protein [Synechococcus sp. BS56D]
MFSQVLIIPCAGLSKRYHSPKPKYLWTNPNSSEPLLWTAIESLYEEYESIHFIFNREHEQLYSSRLIVDQLASHFNAKNLYSHIIPSLTNGPAETVACVIPEISTTDFSFTIKDCDSIIKLPSNNISPCSNFIAYADAHRISINALEAKSSLSYDNNRNVIHVAEKVIYTPNVSVGMYGFESSDAYCDAFNEILNHYKNRPTEVFASHVIEIMIKNGHTFSATEVESFVDLGTKTDYIQLQESFRTIFCDVDGVIFQNRGKYGALTWYDDPVPLEENIKILKNLVDRGNSLVLTTSRPEALRDMTHQQLISAGLSYNQLIMGLNHAPRLLINDFADSNPYPSASSISIPRNSSLASYLS